MFELHLYMIYVTFYLIYVSSHTLTYLFRGQNNNSKSITVFNCHSSFNATWNAGFDGSIVGHCFEGALRKEKNRTWGTSSPARIVGLRHLQRYYYICLWVTMRACIDSYLNERIIFGMLHSRFIRPVPTSVRCTIEEKSERKQIREKLCHGFGLICSRCQTITPGSSGRHSMHCGLKRSPISITIELNPAFC